MSRAPPGVLVTGATTPLGARLVRRLVASGAAARVLAVGIEPAEDVAPALREPPVHYLRVDLTRSRNVRELLFGPAFEHDIGAIAHLALHRSVRIQGRRARKLNVSATRNLLWLAEQHPRIRRFVFQSTHAVYRIDAATPTVMREDVELDLSPDAPQWLRDRVEADLAVCARLHNPALDIAVLRFAELLAPRCGSQLFDYLSGRICFRPLGYNPMINVLTVEDAVEAWRAAIEREARGVFNIPGADTLRLSQAIAKMCRIDAPIPGQLMGPVYTWRARLKGAEFRWKMHRGRFHTGHLLDGTRARQELGYRPAHPVAWPCPDAGPPARI